MSKTLKNNKKKESDSQGYNENIDTNAVRFFQEKLKYTIGPVGLKENIETNDIVIVDVRKAEDYEKGHIPKAISIPKDELVEKLGLLVKDRSTVVYCYTQQCHLAAKAALILAQKGYPVMELEGGIDSWINDYGFPVE